MKARWHLPRRLEDVLTDEVACFDFPGSVVLRAGSTHCIQPSYPQHASWRENARYLLVRGSYITAEDIASAPHLKAIGRQGVGTDKIDAAVCQARGIKVLNTPGVNARAVAELVVALMTGLAR